MRQAIFRRGPEIHLLERGSLDAGSQEVADGEMPQLMPPESAQRNGDPELGYLALVNNPYVSCGVPSHVYEQFFGSAAPQERLPDRNALNANRRYFETAFTTEDGVELVGNNCLQCHASYLDGELVVGLGDTSFDYTRDTAGAAGAVVALIPEDSPERPYIEKWSQRVRTIAPYVKTLTRGVNPADSLTEILLAHRDRNTLEWQESPLLPLEEPYAIPVSVPPWWIMKKKNTMFYTGSGQGDHARFMMTASTLCTDSVEEARRIDAYFPDVRAFILSLDPPTYPRVIDESKASAGQVIFENNCAGCHGTYGADESFPNLLVSLDLIGTDSMLSESAFNSKLEYFDWYNESFFGEVAHAVPTNGYVAPPLDGLWATAPYLHNGSVPTLLGVILPENRPQYWRRDYDQYVVNEVEGGLVFEVVYEGHEDISSASERAEVYDTTRRGYGNAGHNFGAHLTEDEAFDLIEYLKTL